MCCIHATIFSAAFGRLKLSASRMHTSDVRLLPWAFDTASNFFNKIGGTLTKTGIGAGGFFFIFAPVKSFDA